MKLCLLDRLKDFSIVNYDPLRSDLTDEKGNSLITSLAFITDKPYKYWPDIGYNRVYLNPFDFEKLLEEPSEIVFRMIEGFNDEQKNSITIFLIEHILNGSLLRIPHVKKSVLATINPFLIQGKTNICWDENNTQLPIDIAFFVVAVFMITGKLVVSII